VRTIVMVAAPYCYGPTAKLLCVAEELSCRYPLVYVSSEPGLSLARSGPFERCIANEDRDRWNDEVLAAMRDAAAIVSFLDYRALKPAMEFGRLTVFFDTLQWTRKKAPPFTSAANAYLAQRFFEASPIDLLAERWHWLGAVLPRSIEAALDKPLHPWRLRSVVVSLGGLRSPVMIPGADIEYVAFTARLLRPLAADGLSVILCAPIYLRAEIQALGAAFDGVEVRFPTSSEFHDILAKGDLLITVPGLEVVLEAMALSVPLLFLPPYNGSQVLQLVAYQHCDIPLLNLSSACFNGPPRAGTETHDLTRSVQECNRRAVRDEAIVVCLARELRDALRVTADRIAWVEQRREANLRCLSSLGVGGRSHAARIIEKLLLEGGTYDR
jgi:hypothetical protein